jgi:hypothetical protein
LRPPIPTIPWQIDSLTLGQHHFLQSSDLCYYIWEYTPRAGFIASPSNQLILNLKKKPSRIATDLAQFIHKENAIAYAGRAIRSLINRRWLEVHGTLVAMPGSKVPGHADYDDRLTRVLHSACDGYQADIRPLLMQVASTDADHESTLRQSPRELHRVLRINEAVALPTRPQILIFDDVLTTGKHFKVAQNLLRARFPQAKISGLFLARCISPTQAAAAPAQSRCHGRCSHDSQVQ